MNTHTLFMIACADRLVQAQEQNAADLWKHYSNMAHQIAQARPVQLREFCEQYAPERAIAFAPLMCLAWRIVGNEFHDELAAKASDAILMLCDIDEWENATAHFAPQN